MNIFRDPVLFIAFGFGSGLSPKAPGTCGTLVAIPLFLLLQTLGVIPYLAAVGFAGAGGVWICSKASRTLNVRDHQGIVWDEIVGFWISMAGVPVSVQSVLAGFLLFRFFDILKPWPIKTIDRSVAGGLGVMLDDVIAGVFAWLVMQGLILSEFL
ncbi:MAG: phosphatidylglycerophosphatase A [Methylococcaceae bacterium]|nr:phosphatidylglycerophosphatase A [Methylococcaceae bacterium]MCI0733847.1 phosphatidylglycerophosphatase A [Methylococcaceae bacterium]